MTSGWFKALRPLLKTTGHARRGRTTLLCVAPTAMSLLGVAPFASAQGTAAPAPRSETPNRDPQPPGADDEAPSKSEEQGEPPSDASGAEDASLGASTQSEGDASGEPSSENPEPSLGEEPPEESAKRTEDETTEQQPAQQESAQEEPKETRSYPGPTAPPAMQRPPQAKQPGGAPESPVLSPPRDRYLRAEQPVGGPVDREEVMPGRMVARPLTLPKGTFHLGFTSTSAFIGTEPASANAPWFSLGLTSRVEIGISAPLRYDQQIKDWTGVEPIPHVAATLYAADAWELGARAEVRIPTRVDTSPLARLSVPALIRINDSLRVDVGLQGELGFEARTEASLRVPFAATVQFTDWFFSRIRGAGEFGLTSDRTSGLDAGLLFGVTHQTGGQANVDLTLELFAENIGGGRNDRFSDGGGLLVSFGFFPELY